MFTLSFIYPLALLLLLLVPLLWLAAWVTREHALWRLGRGRFLTLLAVRSTLLTALVLALAGVQVVRAVDDTAVVFLLDGSDSFAPAQRERALAYVNEALAAAEPNDRAALVVFGADPAVERAAGPPLPLTRLTSLVTGSRTNLAEALQLGLALLPADAQKRVVLLSDGEENLGRAREMAQLFALRGVPIEVVPFAAERGPDLVLASLEAPTSATEGQDIPLIVQLESSAAGPARLELFADGELVAAEDLTVEVGRSSLQFNLPAGEAGFRRFSVRVTAPFDTQPLNNQAAAFTQVAGPPRILLVASEPERAAPLRAALEAGALRVVSITPDQLPADAVALLQYQALVLVDLPATRVPLATQRALAAYVRDQGGGLAMLGGSESFGAGAWRRTPIAEVLPVELDPPATEQRPDLALALVLDRSGSMSEEVEFGRNRLDLAKEAVFLASLGLTQNDQIGVFAFDELAQTVMPIQPLPDLFTLEDFVGRISLGGGTNIRAGIDLAAQALAAADARVKHLILLTDGIDNSNYADLVEQLRDANTTVSFISIGEHTNQSLEQLAVRGGGTFYRVLDAQEVPEIFLDETVRIAGRDIVEEAFYPLLLLNAPPVRGLGPLPPLYGYNLTQARPTARTFLSTPDGAPILALWQVGLGRSLAWTSDMKGQWARDWLTWDGFAPFAAGMVDALLLPPAAGRLNLELRSDGPEALIDLLVFDADGRPTSAAVLNGRLLDPAGRGVDLVFDAVALGRYRAVAPTDSPGAYVAQVLALDAAGQALGSVSGGLVVSYSPEYRPNASGAALLTELAALTNGRIAPPAASLFASAGQQVGRVRDIALPLIWLCLVLLPLDIALRRLFLRPRDFAPAWRRTRPTQPTQPTQPDPLLQRLQAARERTRRPPVRPATPPTEAPTAPPVAAPPASSSSPMTDEERMARLLAARRRGRGDGDSR
ncbi:MAG: VWA domain-containing protein [Candidatus Viridilinea halotolerans]|uniref:VWA domain-containing protein n=1 Tax=Candidatus Viridilinea halotolerans TaxID=2491704 RepID=A0A426TYI3_9CHLR|nr:MAG: VWA domain-containing protein [Candidatus Viridilinea halotolerans]